MSSPAISVSDLSKVYGRRRSQTTALKSLSLSVERGSIFGLLGPNGAGKTTLIKILLGLVRKSSGDAQLLGEPAGRAEVRRRVGYLPEAHRLPHYLTGRQMLRLFGMQLGFDREWVDKHAESMLARLSMSEAADRKIREYSKGMNQRIGLIQALMFEPEIVFLDEPTDGVDPVGRATIRTLVTEAAEAGTTVFINSHLLMEVEMICDDIVILKDGEVLRRGTLEELTPSSDQVVIQMRGNEVPMVLPSLVRDFKANLQGEVMRLAMRADDQELNAALDCLRKDGQLIIEVRRNRRTLEDVFIELVGETRA